MSRVYIKYIKRTLPLKRLAILLAVSVLAIAAGFLIYSSISKDIQVIENGNLLAAKTMGKNVRQALERMNITLSKDDYVSMPLDAALDVHDLNIINIKRAVPVNLIVDGENKTIMTYRDTVEEVIDEVGITLGALDRFEGVNPSDPVEEGMDIRLVRVKEEIVAENEYIPYETIEKPNNVMNVGETKVVTPGEYGVLKKNYKIVYEDGKPVSRSFVNEEVIKQAVNQIVEFGTVLNFRNSRGELIRYSKKLNMQATAYTASFEDTGKHPDHPAFGITYTGMRVRHGMIAVDPKVIPLGTKVYVEVPGPAPDYGFAIAADIGSAIKGNLIDLYFDSSSKVKAWGRRNVVVYILNEQNDDRWKQNYNPCQD
ncbi:MAG: DUF348 domain-containing protein [Clostridiaceae bacterium]|nr:DUF348 domain-containing protein [Clostridiaceae bacterium]